MDALRKTLVLFIALTTVVCLVPVTNEGSDAAGTMDGLMLYEVYPYEPKGVAVYNYGSTAVDLKGYVIADQDNTTSKTEGWISFSESILVDPGSSVVIATEVTDTCPFTNRGNAYAIDTGGIQSNARFNLNSTGDDVYLMNPSGSIIDAMCYGDKTISDDGIWFGDPAVRSNNTIIQRVGTEDTDSADDWTLYVPGRTDLDFDPETRFDATVTPFLFPDSGGIPIYQTLESAEESVCINIFLLTNRNIYALLCDLVERGVEVNVLLEGEPTAIGSVNDQASYIRTLVDAGGNVRLIGVGDDGVRDRYDVDHAKYAIVDMETVIITSENWTNDNTSGSLLEGNIYGSGSNGNRGWGAIIESAGYAEYMKSVFDSDWSTEHGDVKDFDDMERYSNVRPTTLVYQEPESATFQSYRAQVVPIVSPDNSFEATRYYISNATERVYSEQQSLNAEYMDPYADSPLNYLKEKASQGLDVRLILSTNVEPDYSDTINASSLVKTGVLENPYVHNKGLVCDDVSLVSSVNWTSNSFYNNRETCVAIYSSEIADYFAAAFERDFLQAYSYGGYSVDVTGISESYTAGEEVALTVQVSPASDGLTYVWDFGDGGDPVTTTVPRLVHTFSLAGEEAADSRVMTISVYEDGELVGQAQKQYTVVAQDQSGGVTSIIEDYGYILIPLVVIILAIAAAAMRSKGKRRSTRSKKR